MRIRILLAAAVLMAHGAKADVVVKYRSNAEMANIVSLKMDGTENIKGDKCRSVVTTDVDGGMMAMMGNGVAKTVVNIVRLDKGLFWELEPAAKTYKESTLESLKHQLSQSENSAGDGGTVDDYDWTLEFAPLPGIREINGFNCTGYSGKASGRKKDSAGDTVFITYEQWMTANAPGAAEVTAYQARFAEIVGVNQMWARENMSSMLKGYGSQFEILDDSLSRLEGFPIRIAITIESSMVDRQQDSPDSGMATMMKKMLGSDKSGGGRSEAFTLTTEVLNIEQMPVDDAGFEIPEGYSRR